MARATLYTHEMIDEYVKKGYWRPELTADICDQNALKCPGEEALVDSGSRLNWSQVKRQSERIALGLLDLGLKRDDVLLAQLYSSVELFLLRLACEKAGVIMATAAPTFRRAELEPILKHVRAKGAIIPWEYRGFDFFEMITEMKPHLPELRHIFIVGDRTPQGAISIKEMCGRPLEGRYPEGFLSNYKLSSLDVSAIPTTSGTTGIPKCTEWTACARLASGRVYVDRLRLAREDVIGVLSPLVAGGTITLAYSGVPYVAAKIVMLEHFTPEGACELIEREGVTIASVVPAMIARLMNYPDLYRFDLSSLRMVLTATAILPYQLGGQAEERLGCPIIGAYGAIDYGSVSVGCVDDSREVRLLSVCKPLDGNEVKLVDEKGREVPLGETGQVTVRGPHAIGGYFKNQEATHEAWDKDGWFDMGELGRFDREGNLILLGRKKDTIIRGGQNIYPIEIEELLLGHPKVQELAVVAMSDPVMGQKACACVLPKPGEMITFEDMQLFLKEKKIATFKFPERLELVEGLPLAPGGKVDRRRLEEDVARKLKAE